MYRPAPPQYPGSIQTTTVGRQIRNAHQFRTDPVCDSQWSQHTAPQRAGSYRQEEEQYSPRNDRHGRPEPAASLRSHLPPPPPHHHQQHHRQQQQQQQQRRREEQDPRRQSSSSTHSSSDGSGRRSSILKQYENRFLSGATPLYLGPSANQQQKQHQQRHMAVEEYVGSLVASKMRIQKLLPWQCDALHTKGDWNDLIHGGDLVACAATSAGKTLLAEIAMARIVEILQKKVIVIVPFVALVNEQVARWRRIFGAQSKGWTVNAFCGSKGTLKSFENSHIAVCTPEKADVFINRLLMRHQRRNHGGGSATNNMVGDTINIMAGAGAGGGGGRGDSEQDGRDGVLGSAAAHNEALDEIGLVVVDEVHLIGQGSDKPPYGGRGANLELLLTKLLTLTNWGCQVVALSATMSSGSVQELGNWLRAAVYEMPEKDRPIELQEMALDGALLLDKDLDRGCPRRNFAAEGILLHESKPSWSSSYANDDTRLC